MFFNSSPRVLNVNSASSAFLPRPGSSRFHRSWQPPVRPGANAGQQVRHPEPVPRSLDPPVTDAVDEKHGGKNPRPGTKSGVAAGRPSIRILSPEDWLQPSMGIKKQRALPPASRPHAGTPLLVAGLTAFTKAAGAPGGMLPPGASGFPNSPAESR